MKILKNYVLCLLLIALTQFVYAQKPTTPQDTEKLKVEELHLFEQKKYDQALKIAQQIAQIKEKELGSQHIEFGKALRDIATIQATSGKEKKAESTIQQAISIFESKTDLTKEDNLIFADMYETLGYVKFKDKQVEEALEAYHRALELKEKYSGKESLETAKTLWMLGNIYLIINDFQNAFNSFERVVKIRTANMSLIGHDEAYDALQRFECAAKKNRVGRQFASFINQTRAEINKSFDQNIVDVGIINGKAKKLVRPIYPSSAGRAGITGNVEVAVTINETGKVIFACAQKGRSVFYPASEDAAIHSEFSPTTVNGKPIKVSGIIVYQFGTKQKK